MPWSDWQPGDTRTVVLSNSGEAATITGTYQQTGHNGYSYSGLQAAMADAESRGPADWAANVSFGYALPPAVDGVFGWTGTAFEPTTTYTVQISRGWFAMDPQPYVAQRPIPLAYGELYSTGQATAYEYEWAHAVLHKDTAVVSSDPYAEDGSRTPELCPVPAGAYPAIDHYSGQYSSSGAFPTLPSAPTNPDQVDIDTSGGADFGWPGLSLFNPWVALPPGGVSGVAVPTSWWDPQGHLVFTVISDEDAAGNPPSMAGVTPRDESHWGTSGGVQLHLTVTITAPRWRYFSPQVPPLRQVQRDDGLARSVPRASRGHSRQTTPRARGYL